MSHPSFVMEIQCSYLHHNGKCKVYWILVTVKHIVFGLRRNIDYGGIWNSYYIRRFIFIIRFLIIHPYNMSDKWAHNNHRFTLMLHQVYMHSQRIHIDNRMYITHSHFGCDTAEVCLTYIFYFLLSKSFHILSLDWHISCFWRYTYFYGGLSTSGFIIEEI